jgi:3-hydroxyacyl-CoA dehydrogenase / enoyl-CoA hydratase / 3-hydroxybutyryl-CoA epimerase
MTTSPPLSDAVAGAPTTASAAALNRSTILRHVTDDGVCVLTFDRPESAANIFDRATMAELAAHLDYIEGQSRLRGLVLISAKKSIFIAGADLTALAQTRDSAVLKEMVEAGQRTFDRIAALKIPTVAAIHGACVGGGCEIVLACDYRIASPDKATKIGLPETMLGILPAWGGSTRLPRLIGLPKALDLILAGKTLAAKPALKCGLIDEIVPREYLAAKAAQLILTGGDRLRSRATPMTRRLTNNALTARVIARRVEKQLVLKTRGHYPAAFNALEVVTAGISRSVEESLLLERDAFLELAQTEACRNLIRIFFLQERAKKLSGLGGEKDADSKLPPVRQIAVVGAGVMGGGIAQWTSSREIQVILRDINSEAVAKGLSAIGKLYSQGVQRHALTKVEARAGMDRLSPAAVDVPLRDTDIVIEAAVERMDLKKQLFQRLDALAGPRTILASNTSALSISELGAATAHPERVVGIHFFNPVHKMQLVEIVVGRQTSAEVVRRSIKFVQQIGKLPVVVKDSPGFLVNRVLMPYLIEAGHLFERGARVEDIDETMLDFGMPMGPLRLIDEVGLDVCHHVATDLAAKFSDRMHAPAVLGKMIQAGLLGKKSGQGFYCHGGKSDGDVNPHVDEYYHDASCAGLSRDVLRNRMVLLMVNESARCLEEGVVSEPRDVDFGMILGTGWAPFLGGPLRFADSVGIAQLVNEMKQLAGQGDLRFTPCKLLQSMSSDGRKFYQD